MTIEKHKGQPAIHFAARRAASSREFSSEILVFLLDEIIKIMAS